MDEFDSAEPAEEDDAAVGAQPAAIGGRRAAPGSSASHLLVGGALSDDPSMQDTLTDGAAAFVEGIDAVRSSYSTQLRGPGSTNVSSPSASGEAPEPGATITPPGVPGISGQPGQQPAAGTQSPVAGAPAVGAPQVPTPAAGQPVRVSPPPAASPTAAPVETSY